MSISLPASSAPRTSAETPPAAPVGPGGRSSKSSPRTAGPVGLAELPDDVLFEILRHVNDLESVQAVSQTCRDLRRVASQAGSAVWNQHQCRLFGVVPLPLWRSPEHFDSLRLWLERHGGLGVESFFFIGGLDDSVEKVEVLHEVMARADFAHTTVETVRTPALTNNYGVFNPFDIDDEL